MIGCRPFGSGLLLCMYQCIFILKKYALFFFEKNKKVSWLYCLCLWEGRCWGNLFHSLYISFTFQKKNILFRIGIALAFGILQLKFWKRTKATWSCLLFITTSRPVKYSLVWHRFLFRGEKGSWFGITRCIESYCRWVNRGIVGSLNYEVQKPGSHTWPFGISLHLDLEGKFVTELLNLIQIVHYIFSIFF